ncbi:MAG: tRNA uridine-5-carboxymethylaminomethyl(34) synthesis GTPase MnmE [Oscillatoriales cyanobacterium SM2_2_1]|nr:tRNA uridine-5-carboxymethylaminomethyl(34) synthesis GTPase MnmE [Oscillatoriales cyanobacterium SM2_2_1]
MNGDDTIAAIATAIAPQQGSIGIVRLSGPKSLAIAQQIFHPAHNGPWESHRLSYGHAYDPGTGTLLDECLAVWMQAPRSYTRQDVVEFQGHGGMMVVQTLLHACLSLGARLAEPGEFTLRAFLNGRIDLTQAEGIQDLVGAHSPQAAQMALSAVRGKLAQPLRHLRHTCVNLLAEIEARLDFEEDLPPLDLADLQAQLTAALQQTHHWLSTADRGALLRSGLNVAIVGRPNVGKSSLLNAWSRCDRAIVTDLPGTTRDVIDSHLVVHGIPIHVLDTAGIRDTEDRVEQIGVQRSRQTASQADLVLLVIDAQAGWTPGDRQIYDQIRARPLLIVVNKTDLSPHIPANLPTDILGTIGTAAAQNQGIEELESAILHHAQRGILHTSDLDIAINQRQKACLIEVEQSLERVLGAIALALPLDFWTIDLRAAISALGTITGEELTESILDQIFSRFCIGK